MKPQEFAKSRDIEMPVQHHPDLAHLAGYAAGAIDEAASLLVATHLALCPHCRSVLGRIEAMGGEVLERLPASAVGAIPDVDDAPERSRAPQSADKRRAASSSAAPAARLRGRRCGLLAVAPARARAGIFPHSHDRP